MTRWPGCSGAAVGSRLIALLAALLTTPALAHKPSDSLITLTARPEGVAVRWDIALKDLEVAIGLDGDRDGAITWAELEARRAALFRWAFEHLTVEQPQGACVASPGALQVVAHSDGAYAVLSATLACPAPLAALEVRYSLLFDVDVQHRGLLRLANTPGDRWTVFSSDARAATVAFEGLSAGAQLWVALKEGVHHITIGWDHLCFLFALLLPSVLRRGTRGWEPAPSFRPAFTEILKVVTGFTVAHSLTLALAAFDVVSPEARWVEVAIAASVALAALNNLLPFLPEGRWPLAFALGLLHGFGFVSALQDLGGTSGRLWLSVLGFNLGVEVGQGLIVAAFVPLAFAVRGTRLYRKGVLPLGSLAIFSVALSWVWQRV